MKKLSFSSGHWRLIKFHFYLFAELFTKNCSSKPFNDSYLGRETAVWKLKTMDDFIKKPRELWKILRMLLAQRRESGLDFVFQSNLFLETHQAWKQNSECWTVIRVNIFWQKTFSKATWELRGSEANCSLKLWIGLQRNSKHLQRRGWSTSKGYFS